MESVVVRDVMLWSGEKRSLSVDERICLVLRSIVKEKSYYLSFSTRGFILGFNVQVAANQASFGYCEYRINRGAVPPTSFFHWVTNQIPSVVFLST